jgi:hypothetical protein
LKHFLPVVLVIAFTGATSLLADGKMFWSERIPPGVPFQRALLLFQDGKETLVLQSRFQLPEKGVTNMPLGWVVPVPNVPKVGTMDGSPAFDLFMYADWASNPEVVHVRHWLYLAGWFASVIAMLFGGFFCLFLPNEAAKRHRRTAENTAILGTMGFVFFLALPLFMTGGRKLAAAPGIGVEVLSTARVGIYDTRTIRSDSGGSLVSWLNVNGFKFDAADVAVCDRYISNGWCFVTALVASDVGNARAFNHEGLPDPLILRFSAQKPVYPLALTGTIGSPTEVLLYVVSDRRWQSDRTPTQFAGDVVRPWGHLQLSGWKSNYEETNSVVLFTGWETNVTYLTKLRATLKPEDMREDLYLEPAPDNKFYRKRLFKW